jgi:pilus assembly protein CpaE
MTVLVTSEAASLELFRTAIGSPDGVRVVGNVADLRDWMQERDDEELIVLGPDIDLAVALDVAAVERLVHPTTGVVLIRHRVDSGSLGQGLRAGVRELVPADELQGLGEACRRSLSLTRQLRQSASGVGPLNRAQVVTVFSAKGGCGKTTIATNLAAALADGGAHRVCLVDLDLAFGDVGVVLHLQPTRTIADALVGLGPLDEVAVQSLVINHSPGLDVVLGPLEPSKAEAIQAGLVTQLLASLQSSYDFIVVDTPASFTDHVLAAFDVTDYYLLVATLDVAAVKNLRLALQTIELLGYPRERWRVVLNRADAKVGMSSGDVEKALNAQIAAEIPSSRAVPASMNRGVPLVLDNPRHSATTAIKRLAGTLLDRSATSQVPANRRSLGLLHAGRAQHATR